MEATSLRRQAFWWGASLALLPGLLGLPAVAYAGAAVVNILWRLSAGHDSAEALALLGGFVYGLAFGPILQCVVVGSITHVVWLLGLRRLSPWLSKTTWPTKALLWIGAETLYVTTFVWALLALAAYSTPAALSWLFRLSDS